MGKDKNSKNCLSSTKSDHVAVQTRLLSKQAQLKQKVLSRSLYHNGDRQNYYLSLSAKPQLYIQTFNNALAEIPVTNPSENGNEIEKHAGCENSLYVVDVETLIILLLYEKYEMDQWIDLNLILNEEEKKESKEEEELRADWSFETVPSDENWLNSSVKISFQSNRLIPHKILDPESYNKKDEQQYCKLPYVHVKEKRHTIAGLSSIIRFMFNYCSLITEASVSSAFATNKTNLFKAYLGFRGGCLQACSESSIWTRFCEVDMTLRMNKNLVQSINESIEEQRGSIPLPMDLLRFEYHLQQPVRTHNFQKRLQERNKKMFKDKSNANKMILRDQASSQHVNVIHRDQPNALNVIPRDQSNAPNMIFVEDQPNTQNTMILEDQSNATKKSVTGTVNTSDTLEHCFAEGPDISLADLILFPSIQLSLQVFGESVFEKHLPNVLRWSKLVGSSTGLITSECKYEIRNKSVKLPLQCSLPLSSIPEESLYTSDPSRYNPRLRQYTKQAEVEDTMNIFKSSNIEPIPYCNDSECDLELEPLFDWTTAPDLIHPGKGGQLPVDREIRKTEQLGNMAQMIQFVFKNELQKCKTISNLNLVINKPGQQVRIADFCSGGGHLGIFIAWLLPQAQVYLIENKEESLRRAEERITSLNLKNVSIFHCNLTRFIGSFDIGCALHACGSSTDLVLAQCLRNAASFVVSPCCYGGIKNIPPIQYPRSQKFRQAAENYYHEQQQQKNKIKPKDFYIILAHTADQTEVDPTNVLSKEEQGKLAMRLIDTDRCQKFLETPVFVNNKPHKYQTWLKLMEPETASPKNHILVGFCN